MRLFLTWISLAIVLITFYTAFLWYRNRKKQSLFRVKLTILFLLFVLIPTIPLTFFVADLLTRSANLLLLPGIGQALDTSLETIRGQMEERGRLFFEENPDPALWTADMIQREKIHFLGLFEIDQETIHTRQVFRSPNCIFPEPFNPRQESIVHARNRKQISLLVPIKDEKAWMIYKALTDSTIAAAGYPVPRNVSEAIENIDRALSVYNTLSLLKESILQKNLIWGLAVLFVLGLALLSILVTRTLSRGISEPVRDLVSGMEQVAEGNLSLMVETRARDEFRFLVDSFNQMIRDLKSSREKLIIAERLAAWQGVARQISHEIKNSLTPISISLRRLSSHLMDKSPPPSVRESISALEEELQSLQSMAAEFSAFARMPKPKKSILDLNEIVRATVLLIEPSASQIKLVTDLSPDIPAINGDREQLKRLLVNVIKNSIEATPSTGNITIKTRKSEKADYRVRLEIKDRGEGMDEEALKNIFRPGYTTKRKGSGLGLVITQKIVEDHGGSLVVESKKGEGTCFVLYF